jgi:hypothetical protein
MVSGARYNPATIGSIINNKARGFFKRVLLPLNHGFLGSPKYMSWEEADNHDLTVFAPPRS